MKITDKDTSIILSADDNPFGLRIKAFDKNGEMMKGILEVDLLSSKAKQVMLDENGHAKIDLVGNILTQEIEVDLIVIENPNGSLAMKSKRLINTGSLDV